VDVDNARPVVINKRGEAKEEKEKEKV
ncbi:uncharacterized protein METZ01_LOCUS171644, partial [marine metagenome]